MGNNKEKEEKRKAKIALFKAYLDGKSLTPLNRLLHEKAIERLEKGEKPKKVEKWMRQVSKLFNEEL